jgi:hypothetical protein
MTQRLCRRMADSYLKLSAIARQKHAPSSPPSRHLFPKPATNAGCPHSSRPMAPRPALPRPSKPRLKFTRVGPDNSLERLTKGRVGLVTNQATSMGFLSRCFSSCIAFCIRHSVTYSSGVCPSTSLKRAANAERDMPADSARDSTVQGVFTLP